MLCWIKHNWITFRRDNCDIIFGKIGKRNADRKLSVDLVIQECARCKKERVLLITKQKEAVIIGFFQNKEE